MAEALPRRGAEVARGLFIGRVEAVEHREHDQEAEGQRPGQLRAQAGAEQAHRRREGLQQRGRVGLQQRLQPGVEQPEHQPDAERDDDRGHDQAGHDDVEQHRAAGQLLAVGQAGQQRQPHGEHHHHGAQRQRAPQGRADVDDADALPELAEPVQRGAAHREGQPALRPLEAQHEDREHRAVQEEHEGGEHGAQQPEAQRASSANGVGHLTAPCAGSPAASARRSSSAPPPAG